MNINLPSGSVLGAQSTSEAYPEVGEIDLICTRDGIVLVIEAKSSFRRRSQREVWLRWKTTLRKSRTTVATQG